MVYRPEEIIGEAAAYLRFLKTLGCKTVGPGQRAGQAAEQWGAEPSDDGSLEFLESRIRSCRRCRLADERRTVVFGQGPRAAPVMFVGPFPEAEDQETGSAYSGEAGALLTRIIEAIGHSRGSVYICHAVKCRPASERIPDKFEARACRLWLEEQVKAVSPGIICAMGGLAARMLLGTDEPISRLRGRFHEYRGVKVMPTHEPAYLLVQPAAKKAVWEDMKKIMALLEV